MSFLLLLRRATFKTPALANALAVRVRDHLLNLSLLSPSLSPSFHLSNLFRPLSCSWPKCKNRYPFVSGPLRQWECLNKIVCTVRRCQLSVTTYTTNDRHINMHLPAHTLLHVCKDGELNIGVRTCTSVCECVCVHHARRRNEVTETCAEWGRLDEFQRCAADVNRWIQRWETSQSVYCCSPRQSGF